MLMVIFGAGASYDSVPALRPDATIDEATLSRLRLPNSPDPVLSRPPLANQLFETRVPFLQILNEYPECHEIVPLLRGDRPIEHVLHELHAEGLSGPKKHRRLQQLTAVRYYLRDLLSKCCSDWSSAHLGITNYRALLGEVEQLTPKGEAVCIVTFNYDLLIERALSAVVGREIKTLGDYINSATYKMIKLHGSVNWGRRFTAPVLSGFGTDTVKATIKRADELLLTDEYYMLRPGSWTPIDEIGYALLPAIAIPVETKLDFECPPDHVQALFEMIPAVDRILIVGWRATEQAFVDLLTRIMWRNIPVVVVNGTEEGAQDTIERLSTVEGTCASFTPYDGGFTDFVVRRDFRHFFGAQKSEAARA